MTDMVWVLAEARDFGDDLRDGDGNVIEFPDAAAAEAHLETLPLRDGLRTHIVSWRVKPDND